MVKPFEIVLEVNGVGYKALVNQKTIILNLGYSHEIFYSLPEFVSAVFEKPNTWKKSYKIIDNFENIIFNSTSLGYEAIARKKKITAFTT